VAKFDQGHPDQIGAGTCNTFARLKIIMQVDDGRVKERDKKSAPKEKFGALDFK